MAKWKDPRTQPPKEGQLVVVLNMNGEKDSQFWTDDYAYYCDGAFYNLQYDPHLGVMRKHAYTEHVDAWTEPRYPAFDD